MENNEQFKEDLLNVCGNFVKTSLDCIEKQNNELEQLQQEKQQLISFLEDKIKDKNDVLERLEETGSFRISILQSQLKTLQEVLDFVNKGGKDE